MGLTRFQVRRASQGDAEWMARLAGQLGYPTEAEAVARFQANLLQSPEHAVFLVEDSRGDPIGWLHAFVARRLFVAPFAELGGMVVDENHRRMGFGRALLAEAERWAAQSGCNLMRIRTNDRRREAHAFYSREGYSISKSQHVFEKALGRPDAA